MNVSKGGKTPMSNEEKKLLSQTDLKVILGNVTGAFDKLNGSLKNDRDREYWKGAVTYWIDVSRAVLKDRSPEYLKIAPLERAKYEFNERLGMLRNIQEDGIDLIVDDLTIRFETIVETIRVNDLSAVRDRIIDGIREQNKKLLLVTEPNEKIAIQARLKQLIELNNLIPKP